MKHLKNPHPGEILEREFLKPLAISRDALARAIGVPEKNINEIIRGRRPITAETDLRLARFFTLTEGYWLRLQVDYDVTEAKRLASDAIVKIQPYNTEDQIDRTLRKRVGNAAKSARQIHAEPTSEFGRRALEFRRAVEASNEKLLSMDEIVEEVRERRGELE